MGLGEEKVADSEQELIEHLTALAEENKNLRSTLEAAQRLIEHRRTLDEVIAQALKDALGLGRELEEPGAGAAEREREKLQEELQEIKAQREAIRQIVEQDAEALERQLEQMVSCLRGAFDPLSDAKDLGRELEAYLSLLVQRLEQMGLVHRQESEVPQSSVESQGAVEDERKEEGQAESAAEEKSELAGMGAEAGTPLQVTLEQEGEDVPESPAETEGGWEKEGGEEGRADSPEGRSWVVGMGEDSDGSIQGALEGRGDEVPWSSGESEGAQKEEGGGKGAVELVPGKSWVGEMGAEAGGYMQGTPRQELEPERSSPWWARVGQVGQVDGT